VKETWFRSELETVGMCAPIELLLAEELDQSRANLIFTAGRSVLLLLMLAAAVYLSRANRIC
jgi:hypothetical protein